MTQWHLDWINQEHKEKKWQDITLFVWMLGIAYCIFTEYFGGAVILGILLFIYMVFRKEIIDMNVRAHFETLALLKEIKKDE